MESIITWINAILFIWLLWFGCVLIDLDLLIGKVSVFLECFAYGIERFGGFDY